MINVLLVDDDYLARMYLRQLIKWEEEGYVLAGDVCDGKEALAVLEEVPVQIVITDISMPVMDGVDFIREIKKRNIPVQIAVLSCHDDFEYVKEAMRLGASEYVLKNDLNAGSLIKLLNGLKQNMEQSMLQQDRENELWRLAKKGSDQLKREALAVLLEQEFSYARQSEFLREHKWTGDFYCAGVAAAALIRKEKREVFSQVCRQLIRNKTVEYITDSDGTAYMIADLSGISSMSGQMMYLQRLASQLDQALKQYAGIMPVVTISDVYTADGGISKALRQAKKLIRYGFYGARIVFPDKIRNMSSELPEEAVKLLRLFTENVYDTSYKVLLFQQAISKISELKVEPARVIEWITFLDQACALESPPEVSDIDGCADRLGLYSAFWEHSLSLPGSEVENTQIRAAVAYMRSHFTQQITLQTVADAVCRNPAYLSHVFKREVGQSFTSYLQSLRIECVKQILENDDVSIKQAALTAGFCDYRHFSKLFKKETGMSPADWKQKKK